MSAEQEFEKPEDFRSFWLEAASEADNSPLDYVRAFQAEFNNPGFVVETIKFRGSEGTTLHGWIAYEAGAFQDPGFLWIAPYGRESMLPNEYGTRPGFVSLSFNFHGHPAFYQERYDRSRGYFAEGAEAPETWIFRRMFKDAYIAARILRDLNETNSARTGSMGMSQGGGLSIWLGAWCRHVKAVCADMPFLANIGQTLCGNVYRYPQRELTDFIEELPLGQARVLNTVSYYDTVFHAAHCGVPTQVAMGLRDPAAKPEQVQAIYEALPGPKSLITYDLGHDWTPEMLTNNQNWLAQKL